MARAIREQYTGAWYHVINRGVNKHDIFLNSNQKIFFLSLLERTTIKHSAEFHAYCLMDNHYHLLVHTPKGNIGKIMKDINGIYTQTVNRTLGRDGPLMKGRYFSNLIEDDLELISVTRYIHRNPVLANIIKKPAAYPWSSYPTYVQKNATHPWLHTNFMLDLFGVEAFLEINEFSH